MITQTKLEKFLYSGSTAARLWRTLIEVLLSWLIANIGDIYGLFVLDAQVKAIMISALTVMLTAALGLIRDRKDTKLSSEYIESEEREENNADCNRPL